MPVFCQVWEISKSGQVVKPCTRMPTYIFHAELLRKHNHDNSHMAILRSIYYTFFPKRCVWQSSSEKYQTVSPREEGLLDKWALHCQKSTNIRKYVICVLCFFQNQSVEFWRCWGGTNYLSHGTYLSGVDLLIGVNSTWETKRYAKILHVHGFACNFHYHVQICFNVALFTLFVVRI